MKYKSVRIIPKIRNIKKLKEVCDNYFLNKWYTSPRYGTEVYVPYNDIWYVDGPDRSWRFQHHSLASVSHLTDGYIEIGNPEYLVLAKKLIFYWFEHNSSKSTTDMSWHDHSTALRVINICRFYDEWKECEDYNEADFKKIVLVIYQHCIKLADAEFYMPKHNHGLDQDIALFTATTIFKSIEESSTWEMLAVQRLEKQLHHLFGEYGGYREHSPQYVLLLLKNLYSFLGYLCNIKHPYCETLSNILEKAYKYLLYIVRPDGYIPAIGDSENAPVNKSTISKFKVNNKNLYNQMMYLVENSWPDEVSEAMDLDAVFFDAGLVALRNKWQYDQDTTQIIMYSSFHSRVHKHYDDLSFVLFRNNLPLLTEGGKYSYDYKCDERQYVISTEAHNSVMVDKIHSNIFAKNIEKSGITSVLLTKNVSYVSGMHALYQNVNHRRLFVYFKPDILIVIDLLEGMKEHIFDTSFNLHWELKCVKENNSYYGLLNDEKLIRIEHLLGNDAEITSSVTKGQKNPLKGWLSPNYGELKENNLIQYHSKGEQSFNIYQVSVGKEVEKQSKVEVSYSDNEIQLKWKNINMNIQLTDFYEHIYINDKYYRTKKIVKPELIEEMTLTSSKIMQNRFS